MHADMQHVYGGHVHVGVASTQDCTSVEVHRHKFEN